MTLDQSKKAFDSVNRECLWKILLAYQIPPKIVNIIKAFYNNYDCCIINNNEQSYWFNVSSGVRQGCIISPFLFILAIDWCMRTTIENARTGIRWTLRSSLEDLDFADDICLLASNRKHMQNKTTKLCGVAEQVGLNINSKKTKVMSINAPTNPPISIYKNEAVEEVDEFSYLGSIVSNDNGTSKEIKSRIQKARVTFCQLKNIWKSTKLNTYTKLKIYKSNVKSVLLYGAETWRITNQDLNILSVFHNNCLRRICKIYWPKKISNRDLHKKNIRKQHRK